MKLFLKFAAGLLSLLILAVIVVIMVIDPNDYKQQIQDQVKQQTNRDLVITGDLGWSLYPLLGFKSGELTLSNTADFEEKTLLNVKEASVSIDLLPLFSSELQIGEIILDGVEFNFITNKDGQTNLDNLQAENETEATAETTTEESVKEEEPATTTSEKVDLSKFVLSGINISNAEINIIDHQTSASQQITLKSLLLNEFALGKKAHFSLTTALKNDQLQADVSVESDIFVDTQLTTIDLTNLTIESKILADALSGSTLNTTFTSGVKYQLEDKQLDIKAITLNNSFSGEFLDGTVYVNSSDINIQNLNQVSLGKLTLTSSLTGSALQNNKLETNLESNLAMNIEKQTATIDTFEVKNKVSGDAQGDINISFKELTVTDFKNILIKQFEMASQLTLSAIGDEQIVGTVNSDISYDLAQQKLNLTSLKTKINDIQLDGQISVVQKAIPEIRYSLQGNVWDLNPYLADTGSEKQDQEQVETADNSASESSAEPDLSILKELDIKGDLTIAGLVYEDINVGKITNNLTVNNGRAMVKPLTVNLYDGTVNVNGWVDESAAKNQYQATINASNIVLMQLLKDLAQVDLLSGTANLNVTANGQGLAADKLKQGVNATGDFKIVNGELYGINIPYEIRVIKAKIKGETIEPDKLVKKTDFASLTGDFTVKEGVATNQKLTMLSPVIRLDGNGAANLIQESIDYKLGITPLSKEDESTSYADLSGISIPLRIKGTFDQPSFTLDTEGALKAQVEAAKQAVQDKAKQVLDDKAKDILSGKKISKDDLKDEAKELGETLKGLF
ncbi:AsmA family protein [Psychromonas aquatilis]|uniref:AsmA family protein n=1 Tax=Psychromonas aquatilis TaxID=2005072 RepID=A0ABU9GPK4_9GAMM